MNNLTQLTRSKIEITKAIEHLENYYTKSKDELQRQLDEVTRQLNMGATLDLDKVNLAESIITIRGYDRGGKDRQSCIDDAIEQFASGEPKHEYRDLWKYYFGTKNYSNWVGQRSDNPYGLGPKHGSVVFSIEVNEDVRTDRTCKDLSEEEIEAVIYYLLNIAKISNASIKGAVMEFNVAVDVGRLALSLMRFLAE